MNVDNIEDCISTVTRLSNKSRASQFMLWLPQLPCISTNVRVIAKTTKILSRHNSTNLSEIEPDIVVTHNVTRRGVHHYYMEHFVESNICLSGGATGADTEWGRCAALNGHQVIHWSFPGHDSHVPDDLLIRLDDTQLAIADDAVRDAATALGKNFPQRARVARLLKRNYYQVKWSDSCYAIAAITNDNGMVAGGTGWATTMFAQLHPESRDLYVFDQEKDAWFQWMGGKTWSKIESPPKPKGTWAGIGKRELTQNGKEAVRKLMGCVSPDAPGL